MTNDPFDGPPPAASQAPAHPLPPSAPVESQPLSASPLVGWEARLAALDARLRRAAPLFFDEATAAFESFWFRATFFAVLATSCLPLLRSLPESNFRRLAESGPDLFSTCMSFLAAALIVMVPFRALFSCKRPRDGVGWWGERRRRTDEFFARGLGVLPWIPTGSPGLVVGAKLASSELQGAAYLSAAAPGIAFAYLLGGVSLAKITGGVGVLILASAGATVLTLMVASRWEWAPDIGLLPVFMGIALPLCIPAVELTTKTLFGEFGRYDPPVAFDDAVFGTLLYLSFLLSAWTTAVAGASFPSADRSTGFRVAVLIQFVVLSGWTGAAAFPSDRRTGPGDLELNYLSNVAFFVYVYGAFLLGEPETPARRVRRTLPTSFWGRAFTLWLRPGGGTGFMFCTSLLVAAAILAGTSYGLRSGLAGNLRRGDPVYFVETAALLVAYPVLFLGLGRRFRTWAAGGGSPPPSAPAVQVMLLGFGVMASIFAGGIIWDGNWYHVPIWATVSNPLWTLGLVGYRQTEPATHLAVGLVCLAAAAVFLANLPSVRREIAVRPEPLSEAVQARLRRRASRSTQKDPSPWDTGAEVNPQGDEK